MIFFGAVKAATNNDDNSPTLLNNLFKKFHGEWVRSKQETCHLINGLLLVYCDHWFVKVNLRNNSKELKRANENELSMRNTMIDAYAL